MKKLIYGSMVLLMVACSKYDDGGNNNNNGGNNCVGPEKSFARDVKPLLLTSCAANANCHGAESTNGPGALTTYEAVAAARSKIHIAVASRSMPKNATLSMDEVKTILCWIDNGAKNN